MRDEPTIGPHAKGSNAIEGDGEKSLFKLWKQSACGTWFAFMGAEKLSIGSHVYIGKYVNMEANCEIGDFCLIANHVAIIGRHDHNFKAIGFPMRYTPWVGSKRFPSPSCFVDASCGVVVPAHPASEEEVIHSLTAALNQMRTDPTWHKQLCQRALLRANDLTWQKQIERVMLFNNERVTQK